MLQSIEMIFYENMTQRCWKFKLTYVERATDEIYMKEVNSELTLLY